MTKDIEAESGSQGNAGLDEKTVNSLDDYINEALADYDDDNEFVPATVSGAKNAKTPKESAGKADIPLDEEAPITDKAEDEESADKADILSAPEHWPSERKAAFNSLPKDARKVVLEQVKDVERGMTKKSEEFAEQRKSWEAVDTRLKDYESVIAQTGLPKADFIGTVVQGYADLLKDPVAHIKFVMQNLKITPEQFFKDQIPKAPAVETWQDPAVKKVQDELAEIKNQYAQSETARLNLEQQGVRNTADVWIQNMANHKDEAGNQLYPYFDDEMEGALTQIILDKPEMFQGIKDWKQKIDAAYHLHMGMNRGKYQELELQKKLDAKEAERVRKAQTIKPGYGSNASAISGKKKSIDDILMEAMANFDLD